MADKKAKERNDISYLNINKVPKLVKEYHIMNDKDKIKLIKQVEMIVRRSIEYRYYIKFLKDEVDMTKCTFFNNINNTNRRNISIEIHHEPFTLFDIVDIVLEKFITYDEELNPLMIANEVMRLHYCNLVGLVPLSATVHQLVHDGKLFVPLQNVYGNFLGLLEEYDPIPSYINEMLETKLKLSKSIVHDTSILDRKYVYLDVDGFTLPKLVV